MIQNICNICGANYEYINGKWKCPACGAYKQEELSNEEATLLYNAAQKLRVQEFEDAEELYLDIIQKYPKQYEAYWGYVCSRYGIKTEEDVDGKWIPTCCFPFIESFLDDKDFKKAVEYAPTDIANWYIKQADYIERVRKTWIDMAKDEAPYEIFISYKDSDVVNGIERTRDSINALELYNHLARQGYNVFYSRESLRDKIGEKYEPYIFNALKTAKIMILYGTSVEYINSTWVKNEWHRYLKQIARGEKKENSLLVVCDGFSPNELPKVLSSKQCLDGKSKTLYVDIDNYLKQLFSKEEKEEVKPKKQVKISPLHEHVYVDEIVPSTCIARGYTLHKCRCGYEYKDNYTKLAEHKYEYKSTKEPTCTEEGYKEYVCAVCGDIKKESIPAKGHTFGKWIEQLRPTCTKKGKSVRQCEECGFVEEKDIPALNHDWGEAEYRGNTDGKGSYYAVCRLCGEEKVITDYLTNGVHQHKYTSKVFAPTCTEKGYTLHKCICGYEFKDSYTEPKHNFVLTQTIQPTCEKDGKEIWKCDVCGKTQEKKLLKLGHKFASWIEESKPTCLKDGNSIRTCSVCGKVERKSIKSKGHQWTAPKKVGSEYVFDCTVCGLQKKHGLPIIKAGDTLSFGRYYDTEIQWEVLEVKDDKALVLAKGGIDRPTVQYSKSETWLDSTDRAWLNFQFYNTAFNDVERSRICRTTIFNSSREEISSTDIYGKKTKTYKFVDEQSSIDKIFYLSIQEKEKYGVDESIRKINDNSFVGSYGSSHNWCYRTSSLLRKNERVYVNNRTQNCVKIYNHLIRTSGGSAYSSSLARPAMWVDLSLAEEVQKRYKREQEEQKILQEKAQLKANEEKLKSSKSNAWGSLVATIAFAIWAIIDWTNGETIGWGIICSIISICCGIASNSFFKDASSAKEEIEKYDKTKK